VTTREHLPLRSFPIKSAQRNSGIIDLELAGLVVKNKLGKDSKLQKVGLRIAAPEKTKAVRLLTAQQSIFSSPFAAEKIARNRHVSRNPCEIEAGILCGPDCLAEHGVWRQPFSAQIPCYQGKQQGIYGILLVKLRASFSNLHILRVETEDSSKSEPGLNRSITGNVFSFAGNLYRLTSCVRTQIVGAAQSS
jgi:hypothetical protein